MENEENKTEENKNEENKTEENKNEENKNEKNKTEDKFYLDNKLTIGIIDHEGKNYLTKCIYESKIPEKRLASFNYFIVCYDNLNNIIENRLNILDIKDNETTYDLNISNNLINSITIFIDIKKINDFMIYFIQNNDIYIAHNIYTFINDDIQYKDICTLYKDENNKWFTNRIIPSLDVNEIV